jgi:uncharacterized protein YjbI with pentapeptide repeats
MNWSSIFTDYWRELLVLVAITIAAFLFWLYWPRWQVKRLRSTMPDTKARADVEDNFRKTAGQLIGGAAVLLGAGFAYLQFTEQQNAAHDLLISNQVAKGFEQLGSGKVQERMGGIYALEGVMNTSREYHQPVLEALCAFVRDSTNDAKGDGPPATEIQAVLTVIGRRVLGKAVIGRHRDIAVAAAPDLSNARIPKANLAGAALSNADLNGADLREAFVIDADLTDAKLRGANLVDAALYDSNLSGASLDDARLSRAGLINADLSGASLRNVDLSGADLTNAKLGFTVMFRGKMVMRTDLTGAHLNGAKGLTQEQLNEACGDADTKLDPPLTIKPCK